jgi:hypothetical protein
MLKASNNKRLKVKNTLDYFFCSYRNELDQIESCGVI